MRIDPNVRISDLLPDWINGNRRYVLDASENDHPGLTALFIVQGASDRMLSRDDCNTIANLLLDRRSEALANQAD